MTDNVRPLNPTITDELEKAIVRHPAGSKLAKPKPKGPPPGTPNPGRLQREAQAAAEAKRAKPIDPQRRIVVAMALGMAGLILTSSALFSFATIAAAAAWMIPAWDWLVWVVPFFVEAFIIYFGLDAIVNQARGNKREANWALVWMLVFSGVAVVGNAAHTIDGWSGDLGNWRAWVGVAFSALAPLSVVLITKRVSGLVFLKEEQ